MPVTAAWELAFKCSPIPVNPKALNIGKYVTDALTVTTCAHPFAVDPLQVEPNLDL
jgi:hypothetical protein